jgi:hypothetical protein
MITYSKLGNIGRGNLGNQLFQIASTIGIAKKYNHDFFFPDWKYSSFFEKELPKGKKDNTYIYLKEKEYNYHEWNLSEGKFDIDGWLQSEKYFDTKITREIFNFKKEIIDQLSLKYNSLFLKKTIVISVRRGDFVNNPYFFQISYRYYFLALIKNFPDWKQRNIVFTSDDIQYCKYHFSFLKNAYFVENLSPIEQLALASKCDDYIISNSTFSWWMAWLGEKENTTIIRPLKNYRGKYALKNNDKDYFPSRWIPFDERKYKIETKYMVLICKANIYSSIVNVRYFLKLINKKVRKFTKKMLLIEK